MGETEVLIVGFEWSKKDLLEEMITNLHILQTFCSLFVKLSIKLP